MLAQESADPRELRCRDIGPARGKGQRGGTQPLTLVSKQAVPIGLAHISRWRMIQVSRRAEGGPEVAQYRHLIGILGQIFEKPGAGLQCAINARAPVVSVCLKYRLDVLVRQIGQALEKKTTQMNARIFADPGDWRCETVGHDENFQTEMTETDMVRDSTNLKFLPGIPRGN